MMMNDVLQVGHLTTSYNKAGRFSRLIIS